MSAGASRERESRLCRFLPLLLVAVALLPNPAAALPLSSYYFGELSSVFFPLRLLSARELAAGRLALWNPFVNEGSFQLPALYPADLLQALWPSPVFVSWLLTLHLPLAALAAYWLARELGASRPAGFLAGAVYALSGFSLSCLNHYVLLQALALAPFVGGLLRRAALYGGRSVPAAAAALCLTLSTQAAPFVLQAVLLGLALGLVASPGREAARRLAGALALGVGLAGVSVLATASVLVEAASAAEFAPQGAIRQPLQPVVLAQTLLPGVFGTPQGGAGFWGGRFFGGGLPEFLSLYLGPLTLALAAVGALSLPRGPRLPLVALLALGLGYALVAHGRLGSLAAVFRSAGESLLLPQLVLSLSAGFAVERLRTGRSFRLLASLAAAAATIAVAIAVVLSSASPGLVAWTGVAEPLWPRVVDLTRREAGVVVLLALAVGAAAFAVERGMLKPGRAVALVTGLAVVDLARAGAGLNPQVHASFFEPLPEMAALRLDQLDGARVFSYGTLRSPAFREYLDRGAEAPTLTSAFVERQLGPHAGVLDGVELAEASPALALVPRPPELAEGLFHPAKVGELLPWLRNAGVARVLSLDPLSHPALVPLTAVPTGPPGLAIHVYGFEAWPRASVACRATAVAGREPSLRAPYRLGFDPWREVALEEQQGEGPDDALPATCTKGRVRRSAGTPGEERYEVETNASAYMVVRASHARGWRARVDGVPTPVLRANGKHRAIAVPAGRRDVMLHYEAPGLVAGAAFSLVSLIAAALLFVTSPRRR